MFATNDCRDMGAPNLGKLNRCCSNRTGCAVNQAFIAFTEFLGRRVCIPCAFSDDGFGKWDAVRNLRDGTIVRHAKELCMCPKPIWQQTEYPVPYRKVCDSIANLIDYPREIHSKGRHFGAQQPCHRASEKGMCSEGRSVGTVDRRCMYAHSYFIPTRNGNWNVLKR